MIIIVSLMVKQLRLHIQLKTVFQTGGELCYVSQHPLGDTDPLSPVRKVITAPAITFPTGNAELKSHGFTKLVKRDDGVYENVTAVDDEKRYMNAGDPSSIPHIKKKIED